MAYNAYTPPSPYRDNANPGNLPPPVDPPQLDLPPPPPPPAHRSPVVGMHSESNFAHLQSQRSQAQAQTQAQDPNNYSNYSPPGVTPGVDNLGEGAPGGGINGIALGVASSHERESGLHAMRDMDGSSSGRSQTSLNQTPFADHYAYDGPAHPRPTHSPAAGSSAPHASGGLAPAGLYSSNSSQQSMPLSSPANPYPYTDSPYNRYSSSNLNLTEMGQINPNELADDDDWGMAPPQQKRRSRVPFGSASREGTPNASAAALASGAAAGSAAAGSVAAAPSRDGSGSYNAVPNSDVPERAQEKADWQENPTRGRKKKMWIVIAVLAFVVIAAVVGGVLGTVLPKNGGNGGGSKGSSGGSSASDVKADNKDALDATSDEIKKLMNNKDLHKVFPGMDYTPLNAQYPECLTVPPSQNNITRDMAVMSQLTNVVRLYGTDCNQTEMVLEAIKRLDLKDMKIWLGVWLGNNGTTNTRQIDQMWQLIENHNSEPLPLKGIIVGNEVLYRKDLTETELIGNISQIRDKLKTHQLDLPVAISDLGDNWTADMANKVDAVMSNVHPFFAGVEADVASAWTWTFWQQHDVILTANKPNTQQIIAEVGWPTGGGNDCGMTPCTTTSQGSVAGIDELNTFMDGWVCPSLKNGTNYFWFSAFDEPWKIRFNEKGKEWEDKWGLLDVNRNLKKGVTIPDCGGQTVPS